MQWNLFHHLSIYFPWSSNFLCLYWLKTRALTVRRCKPRQSRFIWLALFIHRGSSKCFRANKKIKWKYLQWNCDSSVLLTNAAETSYCFKFGFKYKYSWSTAELLRKLVPPVCSKAAKDSFPCYTFNSWF